MPVIRKPTAINPIQIYYIYADHLNEDQSDVARRLKIATTAFYAYVNDDSLKLTGKALLEGTAT